MLNSGVKSCHLVSYKMTFKDRQLASFKASASDKKLESGANEYDWAYCRLFLARVSKH